MTVRRLITTPELNTSDVTMHANIIDGKIKFISSFLKYLIQTGNQSIHGLLLTR